MTVQHNAQATTNLHVPGYTQTGDPGAVGAGIYWVDTTGGTGAWVLKVRNAANNGWETVASAGGSTPDGSFWSPDAAPASPSAYDDEFDDETFDSGLWTNYDVPTGLTYSEEKYGLTWTNFTSSSYIQGIYQEPASSNGWSIMCKVSVIYKQHDDTKCGLMLLQDTSNLSTSDVVLFAMVTNAAGTGVQSEKYNQYNSYLGGIGNMDSDKWITTMYLRIRADGSNNWYFDWSSDGIGWLNKDDWFANGATAVRLWAPTGFGLFIKSNQTTPKYIIHWFRYSTNTGYDVVEGNRINYFNN